MAISLVFISHHRLFSFIFSPFPLHSFPLPTGPFNYSETGWTYSHICRLTLRSLTAPFQNVVALGARIRSLPWKRDLKGIFLKNVRDLSSLLRNDNDICVPGSIVIRLLHDSRIELSRTGKKTIMRHLSSLRFKDIIDPESGGIAVSDFHLLENRNKPFSKSLLLAFPFLRRFQSFSINVFKLHYHKHTKVYTLHPFHLSKHHKKQDCYQIDLLLDSKLLREQSDSEQGQGHHERHVLTILDLPRLASCFKASKNNHLDRYPLICRQCITTYSNPDQHKFHIQHCTAFNCGTTARRKTRNTFIHQTMIFSKKLNKLVPNVLSYNRRNLYKSVRSLSFFVLDLECTNRQVNTDIDPYSKAPRKGLVYEQTILGGSFVAKAVYPQYPLPSYLALPRALFFDDNMTSEHSFWFRFFSMLRAAVHDVYLYEQDILSRNIEPPRFRDLKTADQLRFLTTTKCDLCRVPFGVTRTSVNGKRYKVHKNLDHDHAVAEKVLRYVLCTPCNLALYQSPRRCDKIVYAHNAVR